MDSVEFDRAVALSRPLSCVEDSWLGATAGSTFSGGCSVQALVLASRIPSCQRSPANQATRGAALLASARGVLAFRLVANHLPLLHLAFLAVEKVPGKPYLSQTVTDHYGSRGLLRQHEEKCRDCKL